MKNYTQKKKGGGILDGVTLPLGIIPQMLAHQMKKSKAEDRVDDPSEAKIRAASQPVAMKKGGMVRGDGCAQRGKTKGTMR